MLEPEQNSGFLTGQPEQPCTKLGIATQFLEKLLS
jgi:hypothetical protein